MKASVTLALCFTFLMSMPSSIWGQGQRQTTRIPEGATAKKYKSIGSAQLNLYLYGLPERIPSPKRPAIVFFFGGGWRGGTPRQFEQHCRYFASRGMVAITVDYRVSSRHNTKALQAVQDAKSAIRWIRSNALELGIDSNRIVAAGGSAGGHLAACTGVIPGFGEPTEDLTISSKPNALILFNPAVALAPVAGYPKNSKAKWDTLPERMGITPKNLSPVHYVKDKTPPTLIFHGQADTTVPFWTVQAFQQAQLTHGGRSELVSFPGMAHGFFNYGRFQNKPFVKTLKVADEFLNSLGFLSGEDTVEAFMKQSTMSSR